MLVHSAGKAGARTNVRSYTSISVAVTQQQAENVESLTSLVLSLYVESSVSS